ncbi:MAG: AtpZ/AtpI family protein [Thermoanaerobaculia bacterium]
MSRSRLQTVADAAVLGLTFPACTVAGYFLGKWLDGLAGTAPTLSFAGGILGVAAGFWNVFKIASRANADDESGPR